MHRKTHPLVTRLRAARDWAAHRTSRALVVVLRATRPPAAGLVTSLACLVTLLRHAPSRPRHLAPAAIDRRIAAGVMLASLIIVGLAAGGVAVASPRHHRPPAMASVDAQLRHRATDRATDRASRSGRGAVTPAKPPSKAARPRAWVSPMPGVPLSSCFGTRWGTLHQGIDFAGRAGTTIRAVGAGTVFGAGRLYSGYGISVVINHGNGYFSHYAHASSVLVKPGQKVRPGQPIAREGSTGDSTGPHLHFEIHHGMWHQVNPAPWLRAHGIHSSC